MTETLDRTVDFTDFETEFEKRCEAQDLSPSGPCENPAKWAVWLKHSRTACPNPGVNMCTRCRDIAVQYWEHLLTCPNHKGEYCRRCGPHASVDTGQVSDFVRWIEL